MSTELLDLAELPVDISELKVQRRADDLAGMRELIDFLEANPCVPLPSFDMNTYAENAEEFVTLRRVMGATDKYDCGDWMYFRKRFSGDVRLDLNISKEQTCERVKVGTRKVAATPALPERTDDVFEWKCSGSILAATKNAPPVEV